ncbi:AAA family ATPase [Salinibacter grassmerensis]|uniref:AAA family ATPase n=1 Tax=Salinibacter grassmerensis TaxID=3040353 RepID=UPI0021E908C3|nr:AAA family ATPase [Salinibacter grassmerensis]
MRITGLDIQGFRAFTEDHSFDLDADVILFTGANGRGKTSVFDAMLWALTGSLPRLESKSDDVPVTSLYSSSEFARVELQLSDDKDSFQIVRSDDSNGTQVTIRTDDDVIAEGRNATSWLRDRLWPQAQLAEDSHEAFSRAFTRSVYLQQDLVRQFVEADTEKQRFKVVSELVEAGRIGELNTTLDNQRSNWSKEINQRKENLKEKRRALEDAKNDRDDLGEPETEDLEDFRQKWSEWWTTAGKLGVDRNPPAVDDSDASSAIDEAIKTLSTLRRQSDRRLSEASNRIEDAKELPDEDNLPDLKALKYALSDAQAEKEEAEAAVEEAREAAAERRKQQIKEQEETQELATLAEIALRHVDERCPVCQQAHDQETTRQHLETLIKRAREINGEPDDENETPDFLEAAINQLDQAENAVSEAAEKLDEAQAQHRKAERIEGDIREWLDENDVSVRNDESLSDSLRRARQSLEERVEALSDHAQNGESLSLRLATIAQESRREEIESRIESLQEQVDETESGIDAMMETRDLANKYIDQLQKATEEFVKQRLNSVSTLLQKIYSKVSPHPTFRNIRLTPSFAYNRGRLNPYVSDRDRDFDDRDPFSVMSSSQINVVALSIFFALNLGVQNIPLKALMLDDPLQSLDDINLLGLMDLIRRSREHRQIILSTHDSRLANLLKRKLRPVKPHHTTSVFHFRDWTRKGPIIRESQIEREKSPVRLVPA